jgi:hypothetical protein
MPTRSGTDYSVINPDYFVCAYCYEAVPNLDFMRWEGMTRKRVSVRIDEEFVTLPEYTSIWTEPHCYKCHRRVLGYTPCAKPPRRHKYL